MRAFLLIGGLALAACAGAEHPQGGSSGEGRSATVTEKGLEVRFEVAPRAQKVTLHFKNVSKDPIRIYLPKEQAFRAGIGTLRFEAGKTIFLEPEPQPHGYVVTEVDFPLISPGEDKTFEQTFTLDPIPPGPETKGKRRSGFETGKKISVDFTYENSITQWKGGAETLDGPTQALFGGKDIPYIWTGKVTTRGDFTAP